jgi:alpha-methylacyl-CoA racemase
MDGVGEDSRMFGRIGRATGAGPLAGLRLVEFSAIGPVPFAVMLLSDLGAEVLRIDRAGADWPDVPVISRGRATLTLDLKAGPDRDRAVRIAASADVLIEGFRPGVMERLGLGPEDLFRHNERLVYGRMTGWGQSGPLAHSAGHDINYIALTGMLDAITPDGVRPSAPLNLLGDYGAGALYLVIGILGALLERERSGRGQIVDAAIIDGAASMLAPILGMMAAGLLPPKPGDGMLSGNQAYYRTFACADGRYVAIGPLELRFRAQLSEVLNIDPGVFDDPARVTEIEDLFASRPRDGWAALFEDRDSCVSPVLDLDEAPGHPQMASRETFKTVDGLVQPAPAPRFSRTPGAIQAAVEAAKRLQDWGIDEGVFA